MTEYREVKLSSGTFFLCAWICLLCILIDQNREQVKRVADQLEKITAILERQTAK